MKKILITGANFINKGAQSMLFITMDEIYKRIPDAEIFFATFEENIDVSKYRFKIVYYNPVSVSIALEPENYNRIRLNAKLKNAAKKMLGQGKYIVNVKRLTEIRELIPAIDLIIDISGFGLGDKWGVKGSENYLNNIRLARKYSKPIILMPQSFGPFDFPEDAKEKLISEIKDVLAYPVMIFAREEQGYRLLKDLGLNNVEKSYDLVLQNKGVDVKNIYVNPSFIAEYYLRTKQNVAVIPNVQCFRHGNNEKNISLYKTLITNLISEGRNVYLVSHSSEDASICTQLKGLFAEDPQVVLFDEELTCLEYDFFVKQFDFIVCSRFHGIVHAYRNAIPCVILGWSVKYIELAKVLGQEKYCFDITETEEGLTGRIGKSISELDKNHEKESRIIAQKLLDIQSNNCFDSIEI